MARPAHDYARVDKHVPVTRRAETTNPYSPVTILIALVATLGILLYAQFLLNPANRGDLLPYALVITAETILITHALLAMWTILSGAKSPRDFAFHESQNAMFDKKAIKAAGLKEQPHSWPIMLDGQGDHRRRLHHRLRRGPRQDPAHRHRRDGDERQAPHLGPRRRPVRRGPGAGRRARLPLRAPAAAATAPRPATSTTHCRSPRASSSASSTPTSYPSRTSSSRPCRSSSNSNVAFVQTPQTYGNLNNMVSRGAGYMQSVFYRFIQPGRNHFNAAFCVGTNVIFRRAADRTTSAACTPTPSPRTSGPR